MENNQAFVAKLGNIKAIEGADRIVQADVLLHGIPVTSVVVGVDTKEGTDVVYFDSNMCLEESTVLADYTELARYLAKRGRVKTIKLKGVYSDGLAVEVDKFYKYFPSIEEARNTLVEGFAFTNIGDTPICHKYIRPVKAPSTSGSKERKGKLISRLIGGQFHFHIDTEQLARNMDRIHPESVVSISRKIHGTSSICSRVLTKRKLSIRDRIAKLAGVPVVETEYDTLYSSRRVIKNEALHSGYYSADIWTEAGQRFKDLLHDGETVYYEIVGWLPNGSPIQKGYNYGYAQGTYGVYVYRMTITSPDGYVVEYNWSKLKQRVNEMRMSTDAQIDMVEEYYHGTLTALYPDIPVDEDWRSAILANLKQDYLEGTVFENIGKKVPDEGIVVRIDHDSIESYKLKSMSFLKKEIENYEAGAEDTEDEG